MLLLKRNADVYIFLKVLLAPPSDGGGNCVSKTRPALWTRLNQFITSVPVVSLSLSLKNGKTRKKKKNSCAFIERKC